MTEILCQIIQNLFKKYCYYTMIFKIFSVTMFCGKYIMTIS